MPTLSRKPSLHERHYIKEKHVEQLEGQAVHWFLALSKYEELGQITLSMRSFSHELVIELM